MTIAQQHVQHIKHSPAASAARGGGV
jgi:hypothetical protein